MGKISGLPLYRYFIYLHMRGKKTGGRQAGTPNKVTTMSKDIIANLLSDYRESGLMQSDFADLEPKDRLTIAERFMQYVMPKVQSVAVDIHSDRQKTIEDTLAELAEAEE